MSRERYTKPFVLILFLAGFGQGSHEPGNVTLSRSTREVDGKYKYLIFPQGSNVQLIYCLTIGTLAKPEGFFTIGVTAGLAYELPYRRTVPHRKPAEVYHRRSRRDLYHKLEIMLKAQGKDGRSCVLKSLCEAGKRNRSQLLDGDETATKRAFLEEILHSIFTFPAYSGADEDEDEVLLPAERKLRSREYDRAYASEHDCDELFAASCPRLF